MGPAWEEVDELVRRAHRTGAGLRGRGVFRITHGQSRLARLLLRLLRMPAAGEAVEVRLEVRPHENGERWRRMLGQTPLLTTQREGPGGLLIEQVGMMTLHFRLEAVGGAIRYAPAGSGLRLANRDIRLPRWLSPRVCASERAVPDRGCTHVRVAVAAPGVGMLLTYEGDLVIEE